MTIPSYQTQGQQQFGFFPESSHNVSIFSDQSSACGPLQLNSPEAGSIEDAVDLATMEVPYCIKAAKNVPENDCEGVLRKQI